MPERMWNQGVFQPPWSAAHLDHDLAERPASQVFISLHGFVETIDSVDDRLDPMLIKERVHAIEGRTRSDGDAADRSLTEDHRHQFERSGLAGQESHLSDDSADLRCEH